MSKRRAVAAAALPAPTPSELFAKAVSRRRERCTASTEYSHANLAAYLASLLPGFAIHAPPAGIEGVSAFPAAVEDAAQHAANLAQLATFLHGIPVAEAEDQWNGHCETCAVAVSEHVLAALRGAPPPADPGAVLAAAYADFRARLAGLDWDGQVAALFAAERRARSGAAGRSRAMWAPLLAAGSAGFDGAADAAAVPGAVALAVREFLAGGEALPRRLQAAAAAALGSGDGLACVPVYLLNYIFDGDELSDAQLALDIESAQYSVHVVGLVLDVRGGANAAYVCDPNGALLPGANMELLSVPFAARADGSATTAFSRFDADQAAAHKGKKKARAPKK